MKKIVAIVVGCLLLASCGGNSKNFEKAKSASEDWIKKNIFPLYEGEKPDFKYPDDIEELTYKEAENNNLFIKEISNEGNINERISLIEGSIFACEYPISSISFAKDSIEEKKEEWESSLNERKLILYKSTLNAFDSHKKLEPHYFIYTAYIKYYYEGNKISKNEEEDKIDIIFDKDMNILNVLP